MQFYSLALKPNSNGEISVVLNWQRRNSETMAKFVVEVKNLKERDIRDEYIAKNSVKKPFLVPDYQDCNSLAICNGYREKEPEMKQICESMNKMIDPIYSFRMRGIVKPWEVQKAKLDQITSTCVVSVFSGPRRKGVTQPTIFRHSSHGLKAFLGQSQIDEDFADLRFVKALVKSMKALKANFKITGFGYSGIYNYRKMNTGRRTSKLSRHAHGMAIDVHYFIDKNGKKLPVTSYHRSSLLKQIKNHFCKYFKVVLGPEYNKLHHNHFHLDLSSNAKTEYDYQIPMFANLNGQSGNFSLVGNSTPAEFGLVSRGKMNTSCR
jgi:hypothetical protein